MMRVLFVLLLFVGARALETVSVVLVTAMQSEMERFALGLPLSDSLAFPAGYNDLYVNSYMGVLGLVTGEGVRRATVSVMALGFDGRFDVSKSYWLFAGIAGVDPMFGSVGSAFWAGSLVHAETGYLFDEREVPPTFDGDIIVPDSRTTPFEQPAPVAADVVFDLKTQARYAYELTKDVLLQDTVNLQQTRAGYSSAEARKPPTVRLGDSISGDFFWLGTHWTDFYRRWHQYWLFTNDTSGAAFATTAMEDTAIASGIASLARAGRANASQFLVLRTASDYSHQPDNQSVTDWTFSPTHMSAEIEAYDAAYLVALPVILDLCCTPDDPSRPGRHFKPRIIDSEDH